MRQPAKRRGRSVRIAVELLVTLSVLALGMTTGHAAPPPPNPSDSEIADAGAQVDATVGEVGALINQVAAALTFALLWTGAGQLSLLIHGWKAGLRRSAT